MTLRIIRSAAAMVALFLTIPTAPADAYVPVTAVVTDSVALGSAVLAENASAAGLRNEVLELALRAHARVTAAGQTSSKLLTVIKKYFPAGEGDYDVRVEQQGERMVLIANLPVKGS